MRRPLLFPFRSFPKRTGLFAGLIGLCVFAVLWWALPPLPRRSAMTQRFSRIWRSSI